jgi:hypothetical protein
MRKIGTISSAAGLIFLGVWMIISKTNPVLGVEVFKWWPAVIVVLGIEVLFQFSKKEGERTRINFLIIPVLLVLLSVNIYNGVKSGIGDLVKNIDLGNIPNINISGLDINNYKIVKTTKTLQVSGSRLYFSADNAKLNIKKSTDGNIRIDGDIYVNENSSINSYDIMEKKAGDGYTVQIKDSFVKKVELDIYIPDGYGLKIEADNLDIIGDDKFVQSVIDLDSGNCNVKLEGAAASQIKFDNGNVNLKDIKDIRIIGNNSNINIDGEVENINIKSDLGRIDVDNTMSKDVNIEMDQGMVTFRTQDNNVGVNIELDQGVAEINDSKYVNAGSTRTFGTGAGKVKIIMNQGAVKFSN